ncbi:MAG: ZIP family metal transporter [Fuerstiella sp.]
MNSRTLFSVLLCTFSVIGLPALLSSVVAADEGAPVSEVQPTSVSAANQTVNLKALMQDGVSDEQVVRSAQGNRPVILLLSYCLLIVAASLLGGWLPSFIELTHTRMQTIISFVGGLMLGIGVFHLLPHAVQELHDAALVSRWMMVGIVMMFVLLRLFHFHNHEPVSFHGNAAAPCDHDHDHDHGGQHDHDHDHDHDGQHVHDSCSPAEALVQLGASSVADEQHSIAICHTHGHSHGLSWVGIALGLSVHTLIDGIALGASIYSEAQRTAVMSLFGLGTFLAILLHKPLDAVSITSLMLSSGWQRRSINLVNIGFALMCPLGAVLFLMGASQFQGFQQEILGTALAFSAGVFICIALSDLLPEMEFHTHNKVQLTVALGAGIMLAWIVTFLEPTHLH